MRSAVVLQHVQHEDCGRLALLLQQRGISRDDRLLFQGARLPEPSDGDLLVVMGGPMGVGDLHDPLFPFLLPESELIRQRLALRLPILGICLGAQLIAHAAGAAVYPNLSAPLAGSPPSPVREVGWGAVDLLHGDGEPAWRGLAARVTMLHWHGDTFDLPPGAVHLASTPQCIHQAFRIGHHAYALQFHAEVATEQVAIWCDEDAAYVRLANGPGGRERLLEDTARFAARSLSERDLLLANILDDLGLR